MNHATTEDEPFNQFRCLCGPRGVQVCIESGDFPVKDAGVRVLQVKTADRVREPLHSVTIAGDINRSVDIRAKDVPLPPLAEGDYLVRPNAGTAMPRR
jgi:diaminopimelate decarboxylase